MRPAKPLLGLALSLAVGAAGGALFFGLHLPLAWMLGAMTATTLAALARAPLGFWMPLRDTMVATIAVLLGSGFTPDAAHRVAAWGPAAALVVGFVLVISALVAWYLIRLGGFDRVTCYFAAAPGGLGIMTLVGEAQGGDPRTISLTHATRILIVVCVIPLYLRYVEGLDLGAGGGAVAPGVAVAGPADLAVLAACGLAGAALARLLRIPNGAFMGPFVLSAAAYYTGLAAGRPPIVLIWIAQVVIGSALGARFVGVRPAELRRVMGVAVGSGLLMLGGAIAVSRLAAPLLRLDPDALLLALAPGGLPEMTLMALALDIDSAFVSTMHIVRILVVVVAAPYLFRVIRRRGVP